MSTVEDMDLDIETMLQNLNDASFEPYYAGLQNLQLTKGKTTGKKSSVYKGEELKSGKQDDGILVHLDSGHRPGASSQKNKEKIESGNGNGGIGRIGRIAKMSHPSYASTDEEIQRHVHTVRSMSTLCSALERRMLFADREEESRTHMEAFETHLVQLARAVHRLSHLMAYRDACDVTLPKHEQSILTTKANAILARRNQLLRETKKERNESKIDASLRQAASLFSQVESVLSTGTSSWPGKIDHIVVDPPRTMGQTLHPASKRST